MRNVLQNLMHHSAVQFSENEFVLKVKLNGVRISKVKANKKAVQTSIAFMLIILNNEF